MQKNLQEWNKSCTFAADFVKQEKLDEKNLFFEIEEEEPTERPIRKADYL